MIPMTDLYTTKSVLLLLKSLLHAEQIQMESLRKNTLLKGQID